MSGSELPEEDLALAPFPIDRENAKPESAEDSELEVEADRLVIAKHVIHKIKTILAFMISILVKNAFLDSKPQDNICSRALIIN